MLHWIAGPMFADKTSILLVNLEHEYSEAMRKRTGRKVCGLNSDKDTRSEGPFSTHKGSKTQYSFPMFKVHQLKDFDASQYQVIGVDEGQFFDDIVETVELWLSQGKLVFTAGLSGTFQQKPFNRYLELLPKASSHQILCASCDLCSPDPNGISQRNAAFTRRIVDSQEIELVGAQDMYIATCWKHFNSPIAPETLVNIKLKKSQ